MAYSGLKKRLLRFIKENKKFLLKNTLIMFTKLVKKQYIIVMNRIPIATNYWQNWSLHLKMKNSSASITPITLNTLLKICIKQSSYSFWLQVVQNLIEFKFKVFKGKFQRWKHIDKVISVMAHLTKEKLPI